MTEQLDREKHLMSFVDYFSNPTGESSEVIYKGFKLALPLEEKYYVNNSGFHR